jgi:hypothetical protein
MRYEGGHNRSVMLPGPKPFQNSDFMFQNSPTMSLYLQQDHYRKKILVKVS